MARYKNKHTSPFGGWRYWQKESGLVIKADSLNALTRLVRSHRAYKGYQPQDLDAIQLDIERQLCSRLTERECRSEGDGDEWVPIADPTSLLDLNKIYAFSKAALDWIAGGRELVPVEEAERRAAICRDCPMNQEFRGCKSCGLAELIGKAIPEERRLPGLHGCTACGCSVQALVNVPEETIRKAHAGRKLTFPGWCFQNAIHEQHPGSSP